MATVGADDGSLQVDSVQVSWLGLRVDGHLALSLHSLNEPGELSQWPSDDDSNINIVIIIIIIITLFVVCCSAVSLLSAHDASVHLSHLSVARHSHLFNGRQWSTPERRASEPHSVGGTATRQSDRSDLGTVGCPTVHGLPRRPARHRDHTGVWNRSRDCRTPD